MSVSVLTPTCDRPVAFALAERWMARQTRQPDEWIVVDGGQHATRPTRGQIYLHRPSPPGARNFAENLALGIAHVTGDVVVCWEDDDYYGPTHLEQLVGQLEAAPAAMIAGDDQQRYYNVARARWRVFQNRGASLCQTAFRAALRPLFEQTVQRQLREGRYGVDGSLWQAVPADRWSLVRANTVVGMKGLPGQVGLGVGHRPGGPGWQADPRGDMLRAWLGADADVYAALGGARPPSG